MGEKSQKRNINTQIIFTMMGLLILCMLFSVITKSFLTQRSLLSIVTQTSVAVIVAIAETYIIASGCIDLSTGSGVAFSGLVVAFAMKVGIPVPIAMILALGMGMALGVFNVFVITVLGIVPFIATLGTNSIFRSIVPVIMDGVPMLGLKSEFTWIGLGKLWGWLPWVVIFMAAIAVVMAILPKKSKFGRYVYAIGSNEQAAYLFGIPVNKIKVMNYAISGALVAFTGTFLVVRVSSAASTVGDLYETNAIVAPVTGGVTLSGGKRSIAGTIVRAFITGVLGNGLNLIGSNYFRQQVAIGVVTISVVPLEVVRERLKKQELLYQRSKSIDAKEEEYEKKISSSIGDSNGSGESGRICRQRHYSHSGSKGGDAGKGRGI